MKERHVTRFLAGSDLGLMSLLQGPGRLGRSELFVSDGGTGYLPRGCQASHVLASRSLKDAVHLLSGPLCVLAEASDRTGVLIDEVLPALRPCTIDKSRSHVGNGLLCFDYILVTFGPVRYDCSDSSPRQPAQPESQGLARWVSLSATEEGR